MTAARRPALDGMRAVAVGVVLAYHLGGGAGSLLPGGYLGVDAFFVLSGYLITGLLLAEHDRTGRIDLVAFWARRVRRLFPALPLVLLAVAAWVWWHGPVESWAARRTDLLSTLAYVANWHFAVGGEDYFAAYTGASPLRHTWSLAVEEQFYLLWPLACWGLLGNGRRGRGAGRVAIGAAAALVASSVAMGSAYDAGSPSRAYYGTDGRVQELAVGVLLALAMRHCKARRGTERAVLPALGLVGAAGFGIACVALRDTSATYYRGGAAAVCIAVAAVVAAVETAPRGGLARALSWRPLVGLGVISYGVYLWHWPVVVALPSTDGVGGGPVWWGTQALRVALTLALATASFIVIERPIQQGRMPWVGRSAPRLAFVAIGCVVLVAGVTAAATHLPTRYGRQLATTSDSPCPGEDSDPLSWCVKESGPTNPDDARAPGTSVVLFGDSTARALDPGLRTWATAHEAHYVQAAWQRCTPSRLLVVPNGTGAPDVAGRNCHAQARDRQLKVLDEERAAGRQPLVLVADFWTHHQSLLQDGLLLRPGTAAHEAQLRTAYRGLVQDVAARGGRVALLGLPRAGPSLGSVVATGRPAGAIGPMAPGNSFVDGYNAVLRTVAADSGGRAVVVDVSDLVCPADRCAAVQDGLVVRSDGVHYTVAYSRRIVPVVMDRTERLLAQAAVRREGAPHPPSGSGASVAG